MPKLTLVQEKIKQALEIIDEKGIDLWLTFVRETSVQHDPILPLIFGKDLTWQSALILTKNGDRIAIVGRYEAETARETNAYDEVIYYDESFSSLLIEILNRLNPDNIAINYSMDNPVADGLSHGMYLLLSKYLKNTPFLNRITSAKNLINALRSRKTNCEIQRISKAIQTTDEIYQATFDYVQPGMTEKQIASFMHQKIHDRNLKPAWDWDHCPTVNAGPETPIGHVGPTDIKIQPGQLLHFDFGVKENDYCSDIQRVMYIPAQGETKPPEPVKKGFDTILRAIDQTVKNIRPGMSGVEVDNIARTIVMKAGYPEYKYATGHHLGRAAHDGGGVLGPMWERYGESPTQPVEVGHVYTIEPGIAIEGYGYIGIEEDILITENGAQYLGKPQTKLIIKSI